MKRISKEYNFVMVIIFLFIVEMSEIKQCVNCIKNVLSSDQNTQVRIMRWKASIIRQCPPLLTGEAPSLE